MVHVFICNHTRIYKWKCANCNDDGGDKTGIYKLKCAWLGGIIWMIYDTFRGQLLYWDETILR